jgi:hypothetical protein
MWTSLKAFESLLSTEVSYFRQNGPLVAPLYSERSY